MTPPSPNGKAGGWLVGPWFDLFFIANLAWPLLFLIQFGDGFAGRDSLRFWQLYYITTPHRWITLLIVFADRDRFLQRRTAFLTLAACAIVLCVGVRLSTGALTCLLAIDYVWNAWHFASQHHGIYRIYARRADPAPAPGQMLEKWSMRFFLLYVILRVASATWSDEAWENALGKCDWLAVLVPIWLVARDVRLSRAKSAARTSYLVSVGCLYVSLLWAVHERQLGLVLAMSTASALFHAVEYLALVSWSVRQRHSGAGSRMGILAHLVPRWGIALAVFVVVLGAGGWLIDQRYVETWLLINVIVAFLHYAYDGLIWRRRASA
jgi:hypothetical protein